MSDVFILRNPTCTCFNCDKELGFIRRGKNDCLQFSGDPAKIAYEIWERTTTPYSKKALFSDLAEISFPQDSCKEIIETLQQEEILIFGKKEVLNQVLALPY